MTNTGHTQIDLRACHACRERVLDCLPSFTTAQPGERTSSGRIFREYFAHVCPHRSQRRRLGFPVCERRVSLARARDYTTEPGNGALLVACDRRSLYWA